MIDPCVVVVGNGFERVIQRCNQVGFHAGYFSVPGYETLSPEFSDYIETSAEFIPAEYPIVLEISGCRFSEEEQAIVRRTIRDDYTYALGAVQRENKSECPVRGIRSIISIQTGWSVLWI